MPCKKRIAEWKIAAWACEETAMSNTGLKKNAFIALTLFAVFLSSMAQPSTYLGNWRDYVQAG